MSERRSNSADTSPSPRPLIEWVLARFPGTPRRRAKEWIESGRVTLKSQPIFKPHEILDDPGLSLKLLPRRADAPVLEQPWRIHPRVTLLYLDSSLAVINKGAAILAVPSHQGELSALSVVDDFLAGRLRPLQHGLAEQRAVSSALRRCTPMRVHRIDLFTSGVLCFAMNPAARADLIEQFRAHTITRQYVAFVDGRLAEQRGTWRHWLWSREGERVQYVTDKPSRDAESKAAVEAVTHYEVLMEFPVSPRRVITKLRLKLDTGRTHQIRAQAAAADVPLVGDRLYHPIFRTKSGKRVQTNDLAATFDRQALHAERLALNHPDSPHPRMEWTAPLPEDLRALESSLRRMSR